MYRNFHLHVLFNSDIYISIVLIAIVLSVIILLFVTGHSIAKGKTQYISRNVDDIVKDVLENNSQNVLDLTHEYEKVRKKYSDEHLKESVDHAISDKLKEEYINNVSKLSGEYLKEGINDGNSRIKHADQYAKTGDKYIRLYLGNSVSQSAVKDRKISDTENIDIKTLYNGKNQEAEETATPDSSTNAENATRDEKTYATVYSKLLKSISTGYSYKTIPTIVFDLPDGTQKDFAVDMPAYAAVKKGDNGLLIYKEKDDFRIFISFNIER